MVPSLAKRWSHAAGETHPEVVPCCWRNHPPNGPMLLAGDTDPQAQGGLLIIPARGECRNKFPATLSAGRRLRPGRSSDASQRVRSDSSSVELGCHLMEKQVGTVGHH